jgi:hypothetical protein
LRRSTIGYCKFRKNSSFANSFFLIVNNPVVQDLGSAPWISLPP